MEAPGQPSVVELWRPTLPYNTNYVEAPWLWRPPGCGGPWATFSIGAVETNPTLNVSIQFVVHEICEGPMVVEAPGQLTAQPAQP